MVKDYLFLLSIDEAKKYLPIMESRICLFEGIKCCWWLRSHGVNTRSTSYVHTDGYLSRDGIYVTLNSIAVRPALHLNLSYLQTLRRTKEGDVLFGNREWRVLNEETGLLLAKDAVCERRYDYSSNDYEISEIRAYLNGELLNELFTREEQKMIIYSDCPIRDLPEKKDVEESRIRKMSDYNVDKVIEQLKKKAEYAESKAAEFDEKGNISAMDICDAKAKTYRDAIKIIKSGGVTEDL